MGGLERELSLMLFNLTGQGASQAACPDAHYQPLMTREGTGGTSDATPLPDFATAELCRLSLAELDPTSQQLNLGDGKRA